MFFVVRGSTKYYEMNAVRRKSMTKAEERFKWQAQH